MDEELRGNAESLWGKSGPIKFGDRVSRSKPSDRMGELSFEEVEVEEDEEDLVPETFITHVAVVTMIHQLLLNMRQGGQENAKFVYLAPTKALVTEVVRDLFHCLKSNSLPTADLYEVAMSGDDQILIILRHKHQAQVSVITPEKWDLFSTNPESAQLVIIHDTKKGDPVLDTIVEHMKTRPHFRKAHYPPRLDPEEHVLVVFETHC